MRSKSSSGTRTGAKNPVAKNLNKFNKPKTIKAKKGKGSYKRKRKTEGAERDPT